MMFVQSDYYECLRYAQNNLIGKAVGDSLDPEQIHISSAHGVQPYRWVLEFWIEILFCDYAPKDLIMITKV